MFADHDPVGCRLLQRVPAPGKKFLVVEPFAMKFDSVPCGSASTDPMGVARGSIRGNDDNDAAIEACLIVDGQLETYSTSYSKLGQLMKGQTYHVCMPPSSSNAHAEKPRKPLLNA